MGMDLNLGGVPGVSKVAFLGACLEVIFGVFKGLVMRKMQCASLHHQNGISVHVQAQEYAVGKLRDLLGMAECSNCSGRIFLAP